jgi:hypothetical protein
MDEKAGEYTEEFSKFPLKKRRFLERYAETGSVSMASQHAGVSRRTHLKWKAKAKSFYAAHEEALSMAIDTMEHEARRRAVEGTLEPVFYSGKAVGAIRRYSDTMLIFLLKAARPEKYRDGYEHSHSSLSPSEAEETRKQIQAKLTRLAASIGTSQSAQHPDNRQPPASPA